MQKRHIVLILYVQDFFDGAGFYTDNIYVIESLLKINQNVMKGIQTIDEGTDRIFHSRSATRVCVMHHHQTMLIWSVLNGTFQNSCRTQK